MNDLKFTIQEMADELIPGVSSEADKIILKKLKDLYFNDARKFASRLKDINRIRESKGLEPLHSNEIFSKSLKKDISLAIKRERYEIEDRVNDEMDKEENFFTIIGIYVLGVFKKDADDNAVEKKFIKTLDTNEGIIPANEARELWQKAINKLEEGEDALKIHCLNLRFRGLRFVLFVNHTKNSFEIIHEYNTPVPYKVMGNEIRFPEANKKLVHSIGTRWKLKKL